MRGFQYQAFTKSVLKVYEKKSIAQELHNINIIPHTSNGQKKNKGHDNFTCSQSGHSCTHIR